MQIYSTKDIVQKIAKETEKSILGQLNELVKRGLLEVQTTGPTLVQRQDTFNGEYIIDVVQSVNLVLKDQEYIEQLEKENKELKEIIEKIKKVI